jgi:hypothetical protein
MKNKAFGFMYSLNVIGQAIFSLLTPAALMFGISWLLINKLSAPMWIYAITLPIGIISGLFSMVKTVIAATGALERLEKQNDDMKRGRDDG